MKYFAPLLLITLLVGCAEPLPDSKNEYVGLWRSNQTSLLITKDGRVEFESNKGNVTTSVSMPIKSITDSEMIAGLLFINSNFVFSGPPKIKDGLTVLNVDGEDLYKVGNDGKAIFSLHVPSLDELRVLVTDDLNLLSDSIVNGDFSEYLSVASMQFQSQFTNEQLVEAYQPFITRKLHIKSWMEGGFILSSEPSIDENGVLEVSGKYLTSPESLKFTLSFVFSNNTWKSLGAHVTINDK